MALNNPWGLTCHLNKANCINLKFWSCTESVSIHDGLTMTSIDSHYTWPMVLVNLWPARSPGLVLGDFAMISLVLIVPSESIPNIDQLCMGLSSGATSPFLVPTIKKKTLYQILLGGGGLDKTKKPNLQEFIFMQFFWKKVETNLAS